MTSPSGSEHVSRYRAIGEFESLILAAKKAQRALRDLREEEAKLNAQSIAEDKKVAASKGDRAKAEQSSAAAAKKSIEDLSRGDSAGKSGETAGVSYSRGMGRGIQKGSQSSENRQFVNAATSALQAAFAKAGDDSGKEFSKGFTSRYTGETNNTEKVIESSVKKIQAAFTKAGDDSGKQFTLSVRERFKRDSDGIAQSSGFEYSLREFIDFSKRAGEDSGSNYIMGFGVKIKKLNEILPLLGQDKLDLDVDTSDAIQSMKALEFELRRISNISVDPRVRIDATRALANLRAIQKLFKDEVAEDIIKESKRIQEELKVIDTLPSGKAFKFWALTALSDMSRVFKEADRGTSVFEKLRRSIAASGGGGGGNFIQSFVSGFDDFSEASSRLLQRLGRVSGELYRMPGIIGVLVSAIPALVAGIGAIGGGALGLTSALGSLSGLVAAGPGIFAALGGAIGGVKSSFGGLADVLKNAREALDQEAEAKEKSRLGTEKALTATQKYQLALRDLGPATGEVTEKFVKFSEAYAQSQKRVGEDFFKEVVNDTENLNKLLPITEDFFGRSAIAVGKLASEGIRMITSGPWKRDFGIIAKNNADVISDMGKAGFGLANVFRNIAVAAGPFTAYVTESLKDGAQAFADWSAQARSDGTIVEFLDHTADAASSLWQIIKNLGNVVNSFFQSTVDEGQTYLRTLEDITGHWADVAKAQESANSPLRQWMTDIRPVLASLGALIGDLAKGIGGLASDQDNITTIIRLLDTLRTRVLPPILDILRELNESGIAVVVTEAVGDMLEAFAKFLDSGATQALSVFVTVLANFFEILFGIATLPGISNVLGTVTAGIAAIAAVSVVARLTGLFKLWDFFTWMVRNKGNLSGAFADAARGAAGLSTVGAGQQALPKNIPSTIANPGSSIGGIGSEVLLAQAKATEEVGRNSATAATQTSRFAGALRGVQAAGNVAKGALSGISGLLGGPWGVALIAATTLIGVVTSKLVSNKQEANDTKDAFLALKNAYGELSEGNTKGVEDLAQTDEKFKSIIDSASRYGITLKDVSGALNGQEQSVSRFNGQIDAQIASLQASKDAIIEYNRSQGLQTGEIGDGTEALNRQIEAAKNYKNEVNGVAKTNKDVANSTGLAADQARTYSQRLAGLSQEQVDNSVQAGELGTRISVLSSALDALSSATSTAEDRSRALRAIIDDEKGAMISAQEAAESWSSKLLDLKDAAAANGKSLSLNSREGLRNRDALEEAAKATRELYLQDIASGVPMDEALKRHQKRITELQKEADKAFGTKKKTRELIETYGDVPEDVKTDFKTTHYADVYQQMIDLKALQASLQGGKSLSEATREVEESKARAAAKGFGDGPGFATGGPVWGQGTRTSDSIRAWLSNGEFVQPTDAVEHYGMPVMEALRTRKLDRAKIMEALPDNNAVNFASGGAAHSDNCPSCASGGHKFAKGGSANWPFPVDMSDTLIKKSWANDIGGIGGGAGGNGWQWQMAVLRKQFPGLPLISGPRPGARTLSGNRSYHSIGRAVDLPPRRDVAQWIRANYGARTKELITPYNDLNLHNGKPHRYTGAIWNQHNFAGGNAHDHWAFNKGGQVDIMKMLGMDNLVPQQQAPKLPTTPRSLSPAASSVINNTTESGTNFGDVIINNPLPERGGDSIRNALYRTQFLL